MNYSAVLLISIVTVSTACSQRGPVAERRETRECLSWRSMKTAPVPPDVQARLQADCEKSTLSVPEHR
ncbi:hypothetical protein [Erwinia sorbitola]|uniref:Lipoprotein n=1 Tax=Erwinia sorbitola TaxID=2681984 RepID=A0A6I6EKT9_9GAMM|nr:hypothetical protein [Erwinia sorbitola]QGU87231.1 hypothetical protein GN242_08405 [Erwinia sorbitola]